MTVTELNNYIKHYLEEDKTHTAIMLTGEWGSGKTYYIENELIPFLQDGKKNKCVVISLYGLEDISEISKSIYGIKNEISNKRFGDVDNRKNCGKNSY